MRDWIAPTNRRYPLGQLLDTLRQAFPYATRRVGRGLRRARHRQNAACLQTAWPKCLNNNKCPSAGTQERCSCFVAQGDEFVIFEYVLLADVNDSEEDAARLLSLTSDIYCLVRKKPGFFSFLKSVASVCATSL